MALRYWVGGTGNWNDGTNHWSTSSGGSPGASVPGSSDDAIFDGNSGSGTCTINVAANPQSIDMQAATSMAITQSANPSVGSGGITINGGSWSTAAFNVDTAGGLTVGSGGTWTTVGSSILTISSGALNINASATVTWATGNVRFTDTSANQNLTCDPSAAAFYDLNCENYGYDVVLQTDIRVTNNLHIQRSGTPTNAHMDTNGNDVYLRGSGTLLTLDGNFRDGSGDRVVYEINAGGTTYIAGSTGWQPSGGGGMTGLAILIQIIDTVTATIRLSGHIRDVNNIQIESTAAGSGATVSFYTDNYNIAQGGGTPSGNGVYSFIRIGPELAADACAFTSYWGSSTIWWSTPSFMRWQWDAATHNLQSATFRGPAPSGAFSVYGTTTNAVDTAQTFNEGTSTVRAPIIGESWMGLGAHDGTFKCYDLILDNPGSTAYMYIKAWVVHQLTTTDNGSTQETNVECQAEQIIDILTLSAQYAAQTWAWYEANTTYIATFNIGGTSSYDLLFRSRVPTNQADIGLTDPATVSYMDVQDNNLSGANVNAYDGTNTDSGNNSPNWLFTEPAAASKAYHYRRRRT